jgi:hypothetical protein
VMSAELHDEEWSNRGFLSRGGAAEPAKAALAAWPDPSDYPELPCPSDPGSS